MTDCWKCSSRRRSGGPHPGPEQREHRFPDCDRRGRAIAETVQDRGAVHARGCVPDICPGGPSVLDAEHGQEAAHLSMLLSSRRIVAGYGRPPVRQDLRMLSQGPRETADGWLVLAVDRQGVLSGQPQALQVHGSTLQVLRRSRS